MTTHRWSGWPGAYCLYCGSEDPIENALGLGWYDPVEDKYDTPEHRQIVMEALVCHADESTRKEVDEHMNPPMDQRETKGNTSRDIGEDT